MANDRPPENVDASIAIMKEPTDLEMVFELLQHPEGVQYLLDNGVEKVGLVLSPLQYEILAGKRRRYVENKHRHQAL
jgi:hypothetical protein